MIRDFGELLDENRALGLQTVHDIAVVDDFMPDIDRSAIDRERPFHGIDGPHHTGAKASRGTKHDFEVWFGCHVRKSHAESPLAAGPGSVSCNYDLGLLSGAVKALS
jgi:hypothetical protein